MYFRLFCEFVECGSVVAAGKVRCIWWQWRVASAAGIADSSGEHCEHIDKTWSECWLGRWRWMLPATQGN